MVQHAHRQRGVRWSPQIDEEQWSTGSNSTPIRTNAAGRPPLPIRSKMRHNRLPPSLPPMKEDSEQLHNLHAPLSGDMSVATTYSNTTASTSTSCLASVLQHPREAVRDGSEQWRKHGKLHRAKLLMKDEESGGNTFVLSSNCSIERYYDVAEKVLDQFLTTSIDEKSELTESYLVGNRLVKFLSTVLPTHKDYFQPDLHEARNCSQSRLVQLLQYLEQLALIIDEDELNKHILKDLHEEESFSPDRQDNAITDLSHLSASPIQNRSSHSLEDLEKEFDLSTHSLSMHSGLTMSTISASNVSSDNISLKKQSVVSKEPNEFFESHESNIGLLQQNSPSAGRAGGDRTLRYALQADEVSRAWDAEYGVSHGKTHERVAPPFSAELEKGLFMQDHHLEFPGQKQQRQQQKQPKSLGSEWSPTFHSQDPFQTNRKKPIARVSATNSKESFYAGQSLTSPMMPTMPKGIGRSAKKGVHATSDSRFRARPKSPKPKKSIAPTKSVADSSIYEITPTKSIHPPIVRESSPKSILELAEWGSVEDKEDEDRPTVFRVTRGATKSDDLSSLGTHEELDTSLRKQSSLRHFKGCVRCLLD